MSSILKVLTFGKSKHKKLPEEWGEGIKQPVNEGIIFYVKYLGSTLVDKPSSESVTAEAIKSIISMAKMTGKKLPRVSLTVKPSGLSTQDIASGEKLIDVSIYRISYCSADATFDRVVAFIATNKNETMECHAFLTSKKKIAQAAALTISQAFTIAFEKWETNKKTSKTTASTEKENNQNDSCAQLIDLESSFEDSMVTNSSSGDSGVFSNGHAVNNGLCSPPPVNGRRKSDRPTNGATTANGSSFQTSHDNAFSSFDVDLDDSFSRLAESRSCLNNNKSCTSSDSTKSSSSPFEANTATGDLFDAATKSTTSNNSTNPFAVDSFNSCHLSSNGLVLPNNLKSLDMDDQEFNQLFSSTAERSTGFTQESEKDFFAEKDDLFSL